MGESHSRSLHLHTCSSCRTNYTRLGQSSRRTQDSTPKTQQAFNDTRYTIQEAWCAGLTSASESAFKEVELALAGAAVPNFVRTGTWNACVDATIPRTAAPVIFMVRLRGLDSKRVGGERGIESRSPNVRQVLVYVVCSWGAENRWQLNVTSQRSSYIDRTCRVIIGQVSPRPETKPPRDCHIFSFFLWSSSHYK